MTSITHATPGPLVAELRDFRDQVEAIKRDAAELVSGLTDEWLCRRPEPGRWSIAECLEHLTITGALYLPRIDAAIERAEARGGPGREARPYGPFERRILRGTEPPPTWKLPAPRSFAPRPDHVPSEAIPRFLALQDQVLERIHRSNGLDLARARVVSPITRLLRLRLGFAFAYLLAHERRHLWQARQVRNHPAFPSG